MTTAFLYKWIEKSSNKWYIGSRTAKNCHPDDGYLCSSKVVKPLIMENKSNWERHILCIGEPKYIAELEAKYLSLLDAKHDLRSFNMHNGNGKFTTTGMTMSEESRQKISKGNSGLKRTPEYCKKLGDRMRGRIVSDENRRNIGIASTGRKQSKEAREKNRIANSGKNSARYGVLHTKEARKKISEATIKSNTERVQQGIPKFGFWVAPNGDKYPRIKEAHIHYPNISTTTIRVWSRSNKNGWSFEPL